MRNELRGGEGPAARFPTQTVEVSGRSWRARDFLARGIDAVRVNPRFFLGTSTLLVAAWALLEVTVALGSGLGLSFNLLAHLVFLEVAGQIVAVLTCGAMEVVAGDEPAWRTSLKPVGTGVRFALALALYLLLVLVGLALLVVPGIRLAARYAALPVRPLRPAGRSSIGVRTQQSTHS